MLKMNPMIKKLVDQNFMTEEQAKYVKEAIDKKESLIVSGHKGWEHVLLLQH